MNTTTVAEDRNQTLKDGAQLLGISLNTQQLQLFSAFEEILYEWNTRLNLTRIPRADAPVLHFLDSLAAAAATDFAHIQRVIDVGSGAGLPGIPLAIAFPNIHFTLLDSLKKRVAFLDEAIRALALGNVCTVAARAEEAAHRPAFRERFCCALARAVAPLPQLAELLLPLTKVGGVMVALKGQQAADEMVSAKEALKTLGGAAAESHQVALLHCAHTRIIVTCPKARSSPTAFPRNAARIKKQPLGAHNRPNPCNCG